MISLNNLALTLIAMTSTTTKTRTKTKTKRTLGTTRMLVSGLQVPESYTTYYLRDLLELEKQGKLQPASFERKPGAWKELQKNELIISVLTRFSIPNLTAINSGESYLEWVDGLQRWEDISEFLLNKRRIVSKEDKLIDGKFFKDLPKQIQQDTLDCPIVIKEFLLKEDDPFYEGKRKYIREYYIKQNSKKYNTPLNNAQIRAARYEDSEFHKAVLRQTKKMNKFYKEHDIMRGNMKERSLNQELTAELMVLATEKSQSSGRKLDTFYEIWQTQYPKRKEAPTKLDHIVLKCIPKILGRHKLCDIHMNTFNSVYAIVGWCGILDEGGIEAPSDSYKRLESFMKEVGSIGKRVKNATTDQEKESIKNTNSGRYWSTTQEGTRSKRNREIRIKCLGKALMGN